MLVPNNCMSERHKAEVKTDPRSVVTVSGAPKREIQVSKNALQQSVAEADSMGAASGQRVERSIIVKMYRQPSEEGKGPTRSTCT